MGKIKSLSWSKLSSFENYRSQFIKTYFEEESFFETKEIIFGKILGTMIELGSFDEDEIIMTLSKDRNGEVQQIEPWKEKNYRQVIARISENEEFVEKLLNFQFDLYPVYEQRLQQFIDGICCLGFLDNCPDIVNGGMDSFREFKTGKKPWDQQRADTHGQLYFYAMLIEEQSGKIPTYAYLDWLETSEDEDGNIIPTGEIKTFKVDINPKEVEKMRRKLPKAFEEMNKLYEKWLESQEGQLEIDSTDMEEYVRLEREKREIIEKQTVLKKEIDKHMKEKKVDTFKRDGLGSFYYLQRKKWDYSDYIISKEETINQKYKQEMGEVNELKNNFEESHIPEVSYNLSFRLGK